MLQLKQNLRKNYEGDDVFFAAEAEAAIAGLHGRWFGGKMITAEMYDQAKFEANELSH